MAKPQKLALIASYPKSGNTWVRMMLSCYYTGKPAHAVMQRSYISLLESQGNFEAFTGLAFTLENFYSSWNMLLSRALASDQYVFKTHLPASSTIGSCAFPKTTKVLHLIRDPREIIPSLASHLGRTPQSATQSILNRDFGLKQEPAASLLTHGPDLSPWRYQISSWDFHLMSWVRSGLQRLTMRYEDLRENPRHALRAILTFLDVPVDESRLEFAVSETELDKLAAVEAANGFTEKLGVSSDPFFGGKRRKLRRADQKLVEEKFGPIMRQLGYL